MSITAITIRNFRSIVSFTDKVHGLNIFVGENDVGKSNILRALNLFFNGEKRHGYELDWSRDYCSFAPPRIKKAEEITIALEVTPPQHFKNSRPIIWKKVWRTEGLHSDTIKHRDGTALGAKSKLTAFLKAMRFDYVPAIKGEEYFQSLMSNLHDMLEATVAEQVRAASGSFTRTINVNTKSLLKEILDRLGLETTIELPSNLRDLFSQLEFTSVSGKKPFSLQQRGDGIKVRHIPIVLRWLAKQANYLSAPGRPKAITVWGYEEPENNLELRRCFEFAKELVAGSDSIQAFVTTHSPAFYSVCRESDSEDIGLFRVAKEDSPPTTTIKPLSNADLTSLDSSMGLLHFLDPHFRDAQEEIERLRTAAKSLTDTSKPTIFCEGSSDRDLLTDTIKLFFPDYLNSVLVLCSRRHGGGHAWVGERMIAWAHLRPEATAVGLFDKDKHALLTKKQVSKRLISSSKACRVSAMVLTPGPELKQCYMAKIPVPYAIEELLPQEVWDHADTQGWLTDRPHPLRLYDFNEKDITFLQHIKNLLPNEHNRRLALRKVRSWKKKALTKYVCSLAEEDKRRVLQGLKPTIEKCLNKLGVLKENA